MDICWLGESFGERLLADHGLQTLALVPAGPFGRNFGRGLAKTGHRIAAFLDTYLSKECRVIDGIPLGTPVEAADWDFDAAIVVTPSVSTQLHMSHVLANAGIAPDKIISLTHVYETLWNELLTE